MKFLMSWLNDYVDLSNLEPTALVSGVQPPNDEQAAVTPLRRYLEGVVVGEIKTFACVCRDKGLFVVEVDCGGRLQRSVSDLPNLKPGLKTAFAVVGTSLANGLFVELREVEGVETTGRICTAGDLGLGIMNEKAIELPEDMKNGTTLEGLMTANDAVLEIGGFQTNPSDAIDGHRDLARKLSLGLGRKQRLSLQQPFEIAVNARVTPVDGRTKGATARYLDTDTTVAAPSPFWLQGRLCAMGIEPLGLTEDLAHYIRFDGTGLRSTL
jgi:phenylalanyl-tRNA synthetase beta chain